MDAIYKVLFGEKKEMVRCAGKKDDTSGKGLVHIYCGDGKGKTTTSVGLTVRAAGSGKKVLFISSLKITVPAKEIFSKKFLGSL